jgi:hypothetical protein
MTIIRTTVAGYKESHSLSVTFRCLSLDDSTLEFEAEV